MITYSGKAQQENTIYFMERIPQSQYLNPANHPDCKWWMGGLLVPVWPLPMFDPIFVHLPIYMDISVPYSLSNIVLYENGKPDRTFGYSIDDQDKFLKKLSPINYVSNDFSLELLNVGFKQGKNYWDLSIQTKENLKVSFPYELFAFPLKGNLDRINGTFDGEGLNASVYQEASIGFNRQFSKYFRVGIRAKALFGIANIATTSSKMKVISTEQTNDDLVSSNNYLPFTMQTEADMMVNASVPFMNVTTDSSNYPDDITFDDFDMNKALKMKNYGWGLDFGFQKDWNSELTIFGSVIDFGFITWKNNPKNFNFKGKYTYNGLPFDLTKIDDFDIDTLLDQFKDNYKATYTENTYKTHLNTKIFLGGNYKFTKKIAVGLLGRMEKYPYNYEYSATASLNLKPFKWGAFTLSESYFKKTFYNMGLGYTIRIGALQWYAIYDNLITALIFPEKARYFSARWGVNLVFGRTKKNKADKNKPLLNTL